MGDDGHYKHFEEVLEKKTTEEARPSKKKQEKLEKGSFVPGLQHPRNTNPMVQCEECLKWILVNSQHKLSAQQRATLENTFILMWL